MRTKPITEMFEEYHAANPRVYQLFKRFAREAKAVGLKRYSARAIFERIRWHTNVETYDANEPFKVNNYYSPLYARMLMSEEPAFGDFFELRELTVDVSEEPPFELT